MAGTPRRELIAWVTIALSIATFALSRWSAPPDVNKRLHAQMGRNLADEALKLAGPGGKVTLLARDTEAFPQPAMDHVVAALSSRLAAEGREVRAIEHLQVDPIRPSEVPSGDFYELLRRLPDGDVIVSLLGPPALLPEHAGKLTRPKAKVVALCTGPIRLRANLPALLEGGLLHAAILDRSAPAGHSFESLYEVIRSGSSR